MIATAIGSVNSSPFQWEIINSIEMMNGTAALEAADIIVSVIVLSYHVWNVETIRKLTKKVHQIIGGLFILFRKCHGKWFLW